MSGLLPEWQFDIAYNAVLQAATAALAAAGYEAERANKHQRTLECLAFVAGFSPREVARLDTFRRKRHRSVYESVGTITEAEAESLRAAAMDVRRRVEEAIRGMRPDLLA